MRRSVFCCLILFVALVARDPHLAAGETLKTRNVIFVMSDGVRWEEVFRGADAAAGQQEIRAAWRRQPAAPQTRNLIGPPPEARREALFPFFWKTIARQGQLYRQSRQGKYRPRQQWEEFFISRLFRRRCAALPIRGPTATPSG